MMLFWSKKGVAVTIYVAEEYTNKGISDVLTAMDIHNREFKRSFRGYNEDEIDDFLDQIVNDYEKLCRDNEKLKEELEHSKREIAQYRQLEKNLQDTLLVAQKTAEEVTTTAKNHAEEMRMNAQQECENLRRQAEMEVQEKIRETSRQVEQVVAEYDRLVREKRQTVAKWKFSLQSELALLEEAENQLPNPAIVADEPVESAETTETTETSEIAETAVEN